MPHLPSAPSLTISRIPNHQAQCFECQYSSNYSGDYPSEWTSSEASDFLSDNDRPYICTAGNVVAHLVSLIRFTLSLWKVPTHGEALVDWLQQEEDPRGLHAPFTSHSVWSEIEQALSRLIKDLVECSCVHKSLLMRYIKFTYMAPAWQGIFSQAGNRSAPVDAPEVASVLGAFLYLRKTPVGSHLPDDITESLGRHVCTGFEELIFERLAELRDYVIQHSEKRPCSLRLSSVDFSLGSLLPHDSPVELMQQKRKHLIDGKDHWICAHWLAQELKLKATVDKTTLALQRVNMPQGGKFKTCTEKLIPDIARLKGHLKQDHAYSKDDLRCSRGCDESKWDELFHICKSRQDNMTICVIDEPVSPSVNHQESEDTDFALMPNTYHSSSLRTVLESLADSQPQEIGWYIRAPDRIVMDHEDQLDVQMLGMVRSEQVDMENVIDHALSANLSHGLDEQALQELSTIDPAILLMSNSELQLPVPVINLSHLETFDGRENHSDMNIPLPPLELEDILSLPAHPLSLSALPSLGQSEGSIETFDFEVAPFDLMDVDVDETAQEIEGSGPDLFPVFPSSH